MHSATSALPLLLGQAAADAGPTPLGLPPALLQTLPLLLMFAVLYLLVFRPSGRQRRQQQTFLASLQKDDEVVTTGGIYGRIAAVEASVVVLDLGERVRIRILRDRIAGHWQPSGKEAGASAGPRASVAPAAAGEAQAAK